MKYFLSLGMSVLLGLISFFGVNSAQAFGLSPAITEVTLDPGASFAGALHVVNDEEAPHTYYLSIQKFVPSGETGQQEFLPPADTQGLPQWIYLTAPSVELKAGQALDVPFTIKVPAEAHAGGYYAAIFFSTEPPVTAQNGLVTAGARTGTLVLLTVKGATQQKMVVKDFARETPPSLSALPVTFRLLLENQGNVHLVPVGAIEIRNLFGRVTTEIPINAEHGRILPGSSRRFLASWQKKMPEVRSGFWGSVREEWGNFAFGRYTATLKIETKNVDVSQVPQISFSVWPWHLGLVFLLILFVLYLVIRLYRRWVIHRLTV